MAPPVTRAVRFLSSVHHSMHQIRRDGPRGLFTVERFPNFLGMLALTSTLAGFFAMERIHQINEHAEVRSYMEEEQRRTAAREPHLVRRITYAMFNRRSITDKAYMASTE